MTKCKWKMAGKLGGIAALLLTLGFAAMAVNPSTPIPLWLPLVVFTYAGIVFLAVGTLLAVATTIFMFVSARDWIKGLRVQSPVIHITQHGINNNAVVGEQNTIKPRLIFLPHDTVCWKDDGRFVYGRQQTHEDWAREEGWIRPSEFFTPESLRKDGWVQLDEDQENVPDFPDGLPDEFL